MHIRILLFGLAFVACPALALYDSKPDASLSVVQGEWHGTLTYRDYSQPDREVTLPTTLFVALAGPHELVLYYAFDDGPGKTVHSYEDMTFDFASHQVTWTTGGPTRERTVSRIVEDTQDGASRRLVFEGDADGETRRYTMQLGAQTLSLQTDELSAHAPPLRRNRYLFKRSGQ